MITATYEVIKSLNVLMSKASIWAFFCSIASALGEELWTWGGKLTKNFRINARGTKPLKILNWDQLYSDFLLCERAVFFHDKERQNIVPTGTVKAD